jgi:ribosomal protein S27AE
MKRPKRECASCAGVFAADQMNGRRCYPCVSLANHGKRITETYGLTAEMYQELFDFQEGRCWICHRVPRSKRLHVDHSHVTGAVRGLLCKADNRDVLGHLRDSVEALQRAIDYLQNPPAKRLWPDRDVTP